MGPNFGPKFRRSRALLNTIYFALCRLSHACILHGLSILADRPIWLVLYNQSLVLRKNLDIGRFTFSLFFFVTIWVVHLPEQMEMGLITELDQIVWAVHLGSFEIQCCLPCLKLNLLIPGINQVDRFCHQNQEDITDLLT